VEDPCLEVQGGMEDGCHSRGSRGKDCDLGRDGRHVSDGDGGSEMGVILRFPCVTVPFETVLDDLDK
jgi:hypothetical protein